MPTAHIEAKAGQIAATVLMPGDPLRAQFIAEHYLKDAKLFNGVRGMLGYTGRYKNKRVSVMGSGMGMPSMGIYAYELYSFYNVEQIIRIGSAGSYAPQLALHDLVLARGAYTESSYARVQTGYMGDERVADEVLCEKLREAAAAKGVKLTEGKVHSSDVFYRLGATPEGEPPYWQQLHDQRGCVCVEMESFALFHTAAELNKSAACLLTISDSFITREATTSAQREKGFTDMMEVALGAAVK